MTSNLESMRRRVNWFFEAIFVLELLPKTIVEEEENDEENDDEPEELREENDDDDDDSHQMIEREEEFDFKKFIMRCV